jgi:hemerythrin-like domain-containing protein
MNIYQYIKKDHLKLLNLFASVFDQSMSNNSEKTKENFRDLRKELIVHSESEESSFYKALNKKTQNISSLLSDSIQEHSTIKRYIAELSVMPIKNPQNQINQKWNEEFTKFRTTFQDHIKKEEIEIFNMAKNYFTDDEAEKIGQEMQDMQENKIKIVLQKISDLFDDL